MKSHKLVNLLSKGSNGRQRLAARVNTIPVCGIRHGEYRMTSRGDGEHEALTHRVAAGEEVGHLEVAVEERYQEVVAGEHCSVEAAVAGFLEDRNLVDHRTSTQVLEAPPGLEEVQEVVPQQDLAVLPCWREAGSPHRDNHRRSHRIRRVGRLKEDPLAVDAREQHHRDQALEEVHHSHHDHRNGRLRDPQRWSKERDRPTDLLGHRGEVGRRRGLGSAMALPHPSVLVAKV
jgi:hypothetical protein